MSIEDLVGKTIDRVEVTSERLVFRCGPNGLEYSSYHMQDCCESVYISRIEGNLSNILDSPITEAEETYDSENDPPEHPDSWTWTRQRIKTKKGEVVFVWLGESNGYYGETPYFALIS